MIKSKIDARERALEIALGLVNKVVVDKCNFLQWAGKIEKYLIGDAELPEVNDDNAHLKELFAIAQREMEKINKRDTPDYAELMKAVQTGNAGISAEMPCKSEAE